MVLLEFAMAPGGKGESVSEYVARVIDVIDNGKGLPADQRQKLLEPYMTTREGGTGLGLAIVGKILEDHGGGIELLEQPCGSDDWDANAAVAAASTVPWVIVAFLLGILFGRAGRK